MFVKQLLFIVLQLFRLVILKQFYDGHWTAFYLRKYFEQPQLQCLEWSQDHQRPASPITETSMVPLWTTGNPQRSKKTELRGGVVEGSGVRLKKNKVWTYFSQLKIIRLVCKKYLWVEYLKTCFVNLSTVSKIDAIFLLAKITKLLSTNTIISIMGKICPFFASLCISQRLGRTHLL